MAFVLELQTTSDKNYLQNYITGILSLNDINFSFERGEDKLLVLFDDKNPNLQNIVENIANSLPASIFLKNSKSYFLDKEIDSKSEILNDTPISIGLCPSCQKELFDVSSRRYYYPFISCSSCGGNYAFLNRYPYKRENTSFRFIVPCDECKDEMNRVGKNQHHQINSCHKCGVSVRFETKNSQRYANDAGSFRTMFEVSAKAINDNKRVLIKTTMGYRVFYKPQEINHDSILMMINATKITDNLSLITEEFNALLSIERPILDVTLKNDELKTLKGSNTIYAKYPDDGFSILLCTELQKLGYDYIAYEDVDSKCESDVVIDYDLDINQQEDMRYFLNKDVSFVASGERVSFPSENFTKVSVLSVSDNLIGLPTDKNSMIFDKMEHFDSVHVDKANVLSTISEKFHSIQKPYLIEEASFLSVVAEHNLFNQKCVGAYFDEEPSFLYYDGKNVIRIVPPRDFETNSLIENISNLRDGSDRLVENLKNQKPKIYEKLQQLQDRDDVKLFEAVAIILGLDDESMRGVTKEAMKFVGKGGIQIDTHVKDNRFDHTAFLASIISYQLAGVSEAILSYSIFESFGDYFSELLDELKDKTKTTNVILCGTHFANQSLFSRMQRNLKLTPPYMNKNYPIGKESGVIGGVYL